MMIRHGWNPENVTILIFPSGVPGDFPCSWRTPASVGIVVIPLVRDKVAESASKGRRVGHLSWFVNVKDGADLQFLPVEDLPREWIFDVACS